MTIPLHEYKNDDRETYDTQKHGYEQFWTLSQKPAKLSIGDRVYFVKYGQIDSSLSVIAIRENSTLTCETTGREWSGICQLVMNDVRDERNLFLNCRGFQGFRYRWWKPESVKKL